MNNLAPKLLYKCYVGVIIMSKSSVLLGAWVSQDIKDLCQKMAETKGISLSEYLRQLVIEDLDKRTIFTDQLKRELAA